MTDRPTTPAPGPANTITLWPTYALRGWLAALLTQTLQIETQVKHRIEDLETEAKRLREQLDRSAPVIESLQQSIRKVDDAIRRSRDVDLIAASTRAAHAVQTEASHETRAASEEESEDAESDHTSETPPGEDHSGRRRKRRK